MKKSEVRTCFIVNPVADRKRSVQHISWIKKEAKKRWTHFEINITQKNQNVTELARVKSSSFDLIVACGGDGTINQVVNGLAETDAMLGVLPIGSGNDFVKSLKLPDSLPECFELLYLGHTVHIDLIRYTGDAEGWCANTLGIGLDGLANYHASTSKYLRGHLIYVMGALKAAFQFRGANMEITADGKKLNDSYLMVTACNGKWEGGNFFLAPEAELNDGTVHLFTIKELPLSTVLAYLPLLRYGPYPSMKGVETIEAEQITLQSQSELCVHNDGESVGRTIKKLTIEISKKAIEVVTIPSY